MLVVKEVELNRLIPGFKKISTVIVEPAAIIHIVGHLRVRIFLLVGPPSRLATHDFRKAGGSQQTHKICELSSGSIKVKVDDAYRRSPFSNDFSNN